MDVPSLVACERRSLRLTETACTALWRSSNPKPPPAWEGRHACHLCPLGAKRAGAPLNPHASAHDRMALICPRCCNPSDRLVRGRLCISCYNRAEEVRRGRNRKGSMPRLAQRLGSVSFQVIKGGRVQTATLRGVTSMIEAAMATARQAREPVAFARRGFVL